MKFVVMQYMVNSQWLSQFPTSWPGAPSVLGVEVVVHHLVFPSILEEEPTESPPPDVLPSPPRIDQTASFSTAVNGSNIAGEKERQEFWLLGITELKKGHEIHTTRLKIENLQKALIESISDLRKMEIEMNEILRRKSELLGLPVPNSFP
ncbi:unnamed protein product [Angiostrongylus costaricensis]|uniref:Uncharacterized protein n=1 Tax=Angiostrongylus costaricensis TaxID=334426 RepID=A0A0R3PYW7_ANGCS|nr:unnamed protein product [Angiostrongylus costaricensis]